MTPAIPKSFSINDDNKPKKRRRRRRRKPRQGEVPELAANEPEKADSVNEIASEGLEKEGSVSNQSDAADKVPPKEKKPKSTTTKGKRAPRKNKKEEPPKDASNDSKADDGMDPSAAIELTENADDPKTQIARTKSRVRKKVIKDDPNLKNQADVAESTLVSESDDSTTKPEKKSTKSTKAKASKTAELKSGSEASEGLGKNEKILADKAATDVMRHQLNKLDINGKVVIGEGELDEAPMLYIGEILGNGKGPQIDIAVDPVEGTNFVAKNQPGSMSVSVSYTHLTLPTNREV